MKSSLLTFHSGLSPLYPLLGRKRKLLVKCKSQFPCHWLVYLIPLFLNPFYSWKRLVKQNIPLFTCHISWQIRWRWSGSYIVCVHSQKEGCKSKPCYYISTIHCILHLLSLLDFSISLGASFRSSIMFAFPLQPMQLTWFCTLTRPFSPFPFPFENVR